MIRGVDRRTVGKPAADHCQQRLSFFLSFFIIAVKEATQTKHKKSEARVGWVAKRGSQKKNVTVLFAKTSFEQKKINKTFCARAHCHRCLIFSRCPALVSIHSNNENETTFLLTLLRHRKS